MVPALSLPLPLPLPFSLPLPLSLAFLFHFSVVTSGLQHRCYWEMFTCLFEGGVEQKAGKENRIFQGLALVKAQRNNRDIQGTFFCFSLFKNFCQSSKCWRLLPKFFKHITILRFLLHLSTFIHLCEQLCHMYRPLPNKGRRSGCSLKGCKCI